MASKLPTARGISTLLGKAGFKRHGHTLTTVSPGYSVTGDAPGRVRVDHLGGRGDAGLEDYARAIREAGWTVEESAASWLIVTAKGNGNG